MKTLLTSTGLTILTSIHHILNKLANKKKYTGILYATYEQNEVLKPIQEKIAGTSLYSLSIFKKKSLIKRGSTNKIIRFTNIINKPFIGIYTDEKKFRKKLQEFLYINHKAFLEKQQFTSIVMIDEFSLPHTTLTIAANQMNIPTIALQHGVIYTSDKEYLAKEGYIEYKKRTDAHAVVKHLIVYSENEKKYLMQNSPHLQAIALGCPRYDALQQTLSQQEKRNLKKDMGLNRGEKIIVWATQTHHYEKINSTENTANCEALFPFFSQHQKEFQLIIKLHPNENQKAPLYHHWNKKTNAHALIIGKEMKTEKLLSIADAVIVKNTAVGMEAILMNKPIIQLCVGNTKEELYYTQEGFKTVIRTAKELTRIEQIFDKKEQKEFQNARKAYITRRFNNFGSATNKIAAFIKKTIHNTYKENKASKKR